MLLLVHAPPEPTKLPMIPQPGNDITAWRAQACSAAARRAPLLWKWPCCRPCLVQARSAGLVVLSSGTPAPTRTRSAAASWRCCCKGKPRWWCRWAHHTLTPATLSPRATAAAGAGSARCYRVLRVRIPFAACGGMAHLGSLACSTTWPSIDVGAARVWHAIHKAFL